MKFNEKAYNELYPRPVKTEKVETAVEGFTPSVKKEVENEQTAESLTAVETETEVEDGGNGADCTVS